jgi:hypothetical protein
LILRHAAQFTGPMSSCHAGADFAMKPPPAQWRAILALGVDLVELGFANAACRHQHELV